MLPATITPGVINIPGRDPHTRAVAESLLEQDRQKHHCFFNPQGFHNHLSHHLLAAYDLGAPAPLLQAIYDTECQIQKPLRVEGETSLEQVNITPDNLAQYVGQAKYYHAFLTFFTEQIKEHGASETMERLIFAPSVNVDGLQMLARFMNGLYHPFIQTGYGAEFGSDAMIAQGLAQAAVHSPIDLAESNSAEDAPIGGRKKHLLHILSELYDSDVLNPPPYSPDKLLSQHRLDALKDGRAEVIKKLSASWWNHVPLEAQASDLDARVEELFWTSVLLLSGTGKRDRKPRMDFFFMHMLNATFFLPSLLKIVSNDTSKVKLLKTFESMMLVLVLARGRPRIDAGLAMSYSVSPRPPGQPSTKLVSSAGAIGNPSETYNPWLTICASVIHAPDTHTIKVIRALHYAAQHYGHKKAQDIPGSFDEGERGETLPGTSKLDGTLFVRAAGVVMDTLGWVTHGDEPGAWDYSGLGWDDAWKRPD